MEDSGDPGSVSPAPSPSPTPQMPQSDTDTGCPPNIRSVVDAIISGGLKNDSPDIQNTRLNELIGFMYDDILKTSGGETELTLYLTEYFDHPRGKSECINTYLANKGVFETIRNVIEKNRTHYEFLGMTFMLFCCIRGDHAWGKIMELNIFSVVESVLSDYECHHYDNVEELHWAWSQIRKKYTKWSRKYTPPPSSPTH